MKNGLLIFMILSCCFTWSFAQVDEKSEEVLYTADEFPRFPGCEEIKGDIEEKNACAQKKMLEYVYGNLKYPKKAREKGTEGRVIVQFVVAKDGSIEDVKLLRDLGDGCGEAIVEVVKSMNNLPEKWIPGKNKGEAVTVKYTLPVNFKLGGK